MMGLEMRTGIQDEFSLEYNTNVCTDKILALYSYKVFLLENFALNYWTDGAEQ